MERIYVAGPYSADNVIDVLRNIGIGQLTCAKLFSMGYAPFPPWHDKTFITDLPNHPFTVEQFYKYSMAWLEVSDAMLLIPGWEKSAGTLKEMEYAEANGIPIYYSMEELRTNNF